MHPKAVTDSTNYWIPQVTLEGHVSSVSPTSKPPDSKVSRRALLSMFFCCVGVEQGGGDSVTSLLPQRHNYFSRVVFSLHRGSTRAHTLSPLLFFLLSSACHLLSRGWTQHHCSTTAHLHRVRKACGREKCICQPLYPCFIEDHSRVMSKFPTWTKDGSKNDISCGSSLAEERIPFSLPSSKTRLDAIYSLGLVKPITFLMHKASSKCPQVRRSS